MVGRRERAREWNDGWPTAEWTGQHIAEKGRRSFHDLVYSPKYRVTSAFRSATLKGLIR